MAHAALFDLLPDFGAGPPRAVSAAAERGNEPVPAAQPVDIDALVAHAVAEAEAVLEARLTQEHMAAMEAERQAHAQEIKATLESLGDEAGRAIVEGIGNMESSVGALVGATVTRIVGGLLGEDLQKRSLDALARTIHESIRDIEAVRIGVCGPQPLFETLKMALGPLADQLDFTEAPGFDLTVVIDDAVFETRMAEWSKALTEVLA